MTVQISDKLLSVSKDVEDGGSQNNWAAVNLEFLAPCFQAGPSSHCPRQLGLSNHPSLLEHHDCLPMLSFCLCVCFLVNEDP